MADKLSRDGMKKYLDEGEQVVVLSKRGDEVDICWDTKTLQDATRMCQVAIRYFNDMLQNLKTTSKLPRPEC